MSMTPAEWMDPRWFAEDFVRLYDQVKDTDPDIREEYGKWADNARAWLADATCGHTRLIAHLEQSPYRSERVWLPLARLAVRVAHRKGQPCSA